MTQILVVDDEASIRRSLENIFKDEGFDVLSAADGESAIKIVRELAPAVVLLDIWMPGRDGMETLKEIKALAPQTAVIMISGHATIATAISATRLGAADFIEKPLDLNVTLEAVRRVLTPAPVAAQLDVVLDPSPQNRAELGIDSSPVERITPIVFGQQTHRGRKVQQRTLAQSAILYGQGLHSGKKSGLILEPLPPNSGIHFVGIADSTPVPAHVDYVGSTGFATTVSLGATRAGTIEHLMSALHAYRVSNLLIKCNGEVPVMDGSARQFCALIEEIGLDVQQGDWFEIEVSKKLRVGKDREWIEIEAADDFVIDYTLDYPAPLGRQHMVFRLNDVEAYKSAIAPSRTFGFVKDIGALQKQGLALGGRFDNFVLFGDQGAINGELRFKDEPVRHKILDAIGDLYLLGRPLRGKVTAHMTGHSDNIALLKLLREELRGG